jgi:hypothetical protein
MNSVAVIVIVVVLLVVFYYFYCKTRTAVASKAADKAVETLTVHPDYDTYELLYDKVNDRVLQLYEQNGNPTFMDVPEVTIGEIAESAGRELNAELGGLVMSGLPVSRTNHWIDRHPNIYQHHLNSQYNFGTVNNVVRAHPIIDNTTGTTSSRNPFVLV